MFYKILFIGLQEFKQKPWLVVLGISCHVYLRLLDNTIAPKGDFNLLGYSTHCLKVLD